MIADAGLTVREAIRKNVDPYRDLELDREDWTDEQLLDFMLQHPILINRPFVATELGTRLSRPVRIGFRNSATPTKGCFYVKKTVNKCLDANGQRLK